MLILTRSKLGVIYYTSTRNGRWSCTHIHVREAATHVSTSTITPQRENSAFRDASFPLKIRSTNGQRGIWYDSSCCCCCYQRRSLKNDIFISLRENVISTRYNTPRVQLFRVYKMITRARRKFLDNCETTETTYDPLPTLLLYWLFSFRSRFPSRERSCLFDLEEESSFVQCVCVCVCVFVCTRSMAHFLENGTLGFPILGI